MALIEQRFQRVPCVSRLRDYERIGRNLGHRNTLLRGERMFGWRNDNQFVPMYGHTLQTIVVYRQGNHAEVHRIIADGLQDLRIVRALDIDRHVRVVPFELGEHLGKDVEAGTLIRPHHNLSTRHVLGFRDGSKYGLALLKRFFRVLEKQLAGDCQRDPAPGSIQQPSPDLFFERADLRRDSGLSPEAFLRCPREAGQPRYFQKDFELIEVHCEGNGSQTLYPASRRCGRG